MAVKKTKSEFQVVVTPRRLGNLGGISVPDDWMAKGEAAQEKAYLDRCNQIADEIKRHVDEISHVHVEWTTTETCEHCGWSWTPDEEGCNGCCEKELEEWRARNPGKFCEECYYLNGDGHSKGCSKNNV